MPDDHVRADVQLRGNVLPSNKTQSTAGANLQNVGDAKSISSVIPEPPPSDNKKSKKKTKRTAPPTSKTAANALTSTPADAKKTRKEQNRVARAAALRREYPTMQNIPKSITPAQRKKLILHHTQHAANTLQTTHSTNPEGPGDMDPASTTQSKKSSKATIQEKSRNRANSLKQQYPDMPGIPSNIGRGTRKKLIAKYKDKNPALVPSATMPSSSDMAAKIRLRLNELPKRPVPPATTLGMNATHQLPRRPVPPATTSGTNATHQFRRL